MSLALISDDHFIDNVLAEVTNARAAYQTPKHRLAAMTEEVGELAQALLDLEDGKHHSWQRVFDEAVQVAAMAMRVATEGDASIATPNHVNTRDMR